MGTGIKNLNIKRCKMKKVMIMDGNKYGE